MTSTAFVFAPLTREAPFRWLLRDEDPELADRGGAGLDALDVLLTATAPARIVLVVPAELVLCTSIRAPSRSRRQTEAALPYLAEEFLAEDVDELHLAAGIRDAEGQVPIRALRPELLQDWLAALRDAGLEPASALVDVDALQAPDQGVAVRAWLGHDRALLRTARDAHGVERSELVSYLSGRAHAEGAGAGGMILHEEPDAEPMAELVQLEALIGSLPASQSGAGLERVQLDVGLDAAIAQGLTAHPQAVELLTGPWRPRKIATERGARWPLAAGLLLGWVLLQAMLDVGRAAWLEARTDTVRDENAALFMAIVPGRTRSPDPRRELESLLGSSTGSDASLLGLLGAVGAQIQATGAPVVMNSLNWNTQRGDLSLDLSVPSIAQVDRFKAELEAVGYPVTIDSATQEQRGVRARIRVRDGGAG